DGVWVVTSKDGKLHQIYKIIMKNRERKKFNEILNFEKHLNDLKKRRSDIKKREQRCLIEGDEYYIPNRADEIEKENIELFRSNEVKVVTYKDGKLHQIYKIIMKNRERKKFNEILNFEKHLNDLKKRRSDIKKREQRCLIEGDEYYIPNRADEIEKANIEQF